MTYTRNDKFLQFVLAASLTAMTGFAQAELNLSNVPLFASSGVEPNIMFLLDNSGSMSNIVPDAPYDPSIEYTDCPASNTLSPANDSGTLLSVSAIVDDDGKSYFFQSGRGDYDWGDDDHDDERCFDTDEIYAARLYANANGNILRDSNRENYPSGYLQAEYTGNYLNWYFGEGNDDWGDSSARNKPGTQRRFDIARDATSLLVDSLAGVRVGLASYNGGNGARINVGIDDLTGGQLTILSDALDALAPTGSTPLAESLHGLGRYFVGESGNQYDGDMTYFPGGVETVRDDDVIFDRSPVYSSGASSSSPIDYFCQQSFAVLLTDGRPQSDRALTTGTLLRDYDGDCPNGDDGTTCTEYDRKVGGGYEYESAGSDYLDDVAQALFEMDLRPDLVDFEGNPVKNNLSTYMIGFADNQVINDPLIRDTAEQGGGLFLQAQNSAELFAAFREATSDIFERTEGSSASVATNSGSISSESRLFQARFDSSDWSGQLLAFEVYDGDSQGSRCNANDPVGTICEAFLWDAGDELLSQSPDSRRIVTWSPKDEKGIRFEWGRLDDDQQDALDTSALGIPDDRGEERLEYLRGDHANEQQQGGFLRTREHPGGDIGDVTDNERLGDIVNSAPVFVGGNSNFTYPDNWGTGAPENSSLYSSFRGSSTYRNRDPMVYVGANDGMLHAFDATSGRERFAYVPARVFANLSQYTDPGYTHRYYVDGSPTAVDAFVDDDWKTVLATNLRAGGQGIFTLDITTPPSLSDDENDVKMQVMWEFTDADDADLGYVYGEVSIARMQNGKWAAIVGNGYNNTELDGNIGSGSASLFIIDLETGDLIRKLDTLENALDDPTGAIRPNGLAAPAAVDIDNDYIVDFIYAGDLFGNLWKFDVTDTDEGEWGIAYGTSSNPQPLFTALENNDSNNPQAITTRPQIGVHPLGINNGVLVYFGTGKYIEVTDNSASGELTQSFYGIWDKAVWKAGHPDFESRPAFSRSHLLEQEITQEVTIGESTVRLTSDNTLSWHTDPGLPIGSPPSTHLGWYMDLLNTQGGNTDNMGERQVSNPVLRNGRIIFTTILPNDVPCAFGGSSWLLELDARNGGRLRFSPFDLNNDEEFDPGDYAEVVLDNGDTVRVPVSGILSDVGMISTPTIMQLTNESEIKFTSGSTGQMGSILENSGPGAVGRQSWRELR